MGTGGFTGRLATLVAVAVLAAALAAVTLWTRGQERRLEESVASHAGFVLSEVKTSLEARLTIGLALADLPQVDGLLDGARASMPKVLSVAILDEDATVLFSTNAVEVGETVAGLPTDDKATGGTAWSLDRDGERIHGVWLASGFGTAAGAVLLRLPGGVVAEQVRHYGLTLAIGALAVAMLVGLLAWAAGLRLARGPREALSALATELESLAQDAANTPAAADAFGLPVRAFADAVRQRMAVLAEAERELTRLDELA
ncbi:hypothetical protein [Azospirillum sp. sgz301742]